jgi:DNA-binding SARP family transcriptional activator
MDDLSGDSPVTISLISDFELRYADLPITMAPSSQRLICFLALRNRALRRSHVSSTLWLDSSESRANANLRSALWRVPKPDGHTVVCSSHTHVWLCQNVDVDLHRMINRAYTVIDRTQPDLEVADVTRDLSSFGDDVLPGWYDDWVIMERERFRQLRLHVLDRLAEQLLTIGRYGDAAQAALASVQAEPLRESAHRLLIRAHFQEGNIAEAIRQYDRYAFLLQTELHARPSSAMEQLMTATAVNLGGP